MTRRSRRTPALLPRSAALLALAAATACALATPAFAPPEDGALAGLEARVARDSTDVESAVRLAAGHVAAGRLEAARDALARARSAVPGDPTLTASLAMTEQALDRPAEAGRLYAAFLRDYPADPVTPAVQARLDGLRPHVLLAEALERVANGPDAGPARGGTGSVAVVPFVVPDETDPAASALSVALADLIARDLAIAGQPVIDPAAVLAQLVALGRPPAEPFGVGAAARMTALLGATELVYGVLRLGTPGQVEFEVTVMSVEEDALSLAAFTLAGIPADVLTLQKRASVLALGAIAVRVREREAESIARRDVTVPAAVVAYGRALLRASEGDHGAAAEQFALAAELDDGFGLAIERAQRSSDALAVESAPLLPALVDVARAGEAARALATLQGHPASAWRAAVTGVGARERSLLAEVLGQDRLGAGPLHEIRFVLPGGG